MYYAHSGGFSPLENGLFNTTAYTARCMYYMYCVHSGGFSPLENGLFNTTAYNYKMHVPRTIHTVADSVHLRMDSSTPQHTLQDACTTYYAHSGGFSPLENGLFNTTAYTTRCMYYILCTQWRIQSTREWTLQHSIHYKMHVPRTIHTVADSVHLRMDSSTLQHTTTRCMHYVLCTQWRIQST